MTRLTTDDAAALARRLYGLASAARELPSERDQNFELSTERGAFVLKVAGQAEHPENLDLQDRALEWLAARAPDLPVPRMVPTSDGRAVAESGGRLVRLLTFLRGTILADARPQSPAVVEAVGRFLGRLDRGLEGFAHPAARERDLLWNPDNALDVIARHEPAIRDAGRRELIAHFVAEHRKNVVPLLAALPRGIIHNDANDHNILLGDPTPGERSVAGILDFGDMVETWTACEPAVAIAYAIFGKADPLAAACSLAAGYHVERPMTEAEIEALWSFVAIRLCTSVCLSARRRTTEPENAYLLVSEAPAWATLAAMRAVPAALAHYRLRAACGLTPCPRTPAIEAWLRSHHSEIGPVVRADLAKAIVFDLSVASAVFESSERATDTASMTAKLFGALRARGAELGIGRYDEARLLYASDAFSGSGGEHPERRTVHLALDLFLEPGSAVLAPLAGRVHSVRDNAARLDYGPTVILEHAPPGGPVFYTLYGHLGRASIARLSPGDAVGRGEPIAAIGPAPENGDWPPHTHFQIIADMLGKSGDFPGVAAASERATWLSLCPDPNLILGGPDRFRAHADQPARLERERRRRLGPSLSLSYRQPLEIVRGADAHLYDQTGRAYLDMVNNVAHVGHCHPRVARAGARQMTVLNTNTRYLHPSILRYAERLADTLPDSLSVCFFVCSGSEANELALRLARTATGGRDVVVVDGAYHGNTQTLVEVSPYKHAGPGGGGPPPWVHAVPMPDDYRGLHRRDDPDRGAKFAAYVAEAVAAIRGAGEKPAAFLCESLLSCGGQIELPPGYLAGAYAHARGAGAVCIADEVQVGFGRVGTHFWGFETQGVVPDIVTMGKPIGNGHPLGAVVTTPSIAAAFANGMEYFNTFGGNPVSCEIGLAVLDVVRDERLQERALRVGGHLEDGLRQVAESHAIVGDVRGLGLFLGIELVLDRKSRAPAPREAAYVVERMKDHGILLSTDGPDHNVIKMKPPLAFSEADADRAIEAYGRVLSEDFVRCR
ncbi:MAG TPA: aminotransferase class III-fold pyridoxal phosphate-dependent enzyme [Thermoanaerobaculia bacterium]|nr:aminotransferase class III-fold pyridoxal phosphate-dependent enzyme [Thermoanaerobaculia bacterium]